MAKLSTLVAAAAILALSGGAALACSAHTAHETTQQTPLQTAEKPQQTTMPTTTTKTEDAAQ